MTGRFRGRLAAMYATGEAGQSSHWKFRTRGWMNFLFGLSLSCGQNATDGLRSTRAQNRRLRTTLNLYGIVPLTTWPY